MEDKHQDYGETRMIGYATIDARLFCVIYTDRDSIRRIISLRKANNREKENMYLTTKSGKKIQHHSDEEDAIINAGIAADPDTYKLTTEEFKRLRPKADITKERITIRLSPEVLGFYPDFTDTLKKPIMGKKECSYVNQEKV